MLSENNIRKMRKAMATAEVAGIRSMEKAINAAVSDACALKAQNADELMLPLSTVTDVLSMAASFLEAAAWRRFAEFDPREILRLVDEQ